MILQVEQVPTNDIMMSQISYSDIFFQFILVIIAAIAAALIGLYTYFKQKEYELVRQRYLMDCIDLLCTNIDYSLGVFRNNWARSLQLLKQFRDVGSAMEKEDYISPFLPFDYSFFTIVPFYRLEKLLEDNVFWHISQLLYAFIEKSYSLFERDMRKAIAYYVDNSEKEQVDPKKIAENYFPIVLSKDKEASKYYYMLNQLMSISSILEKEKFSFKKLDTFKNREDVKIIIEKMHSHFKDEIKNPKKTAG